MRGQKLISVPVDFHHETEKAYRVSHVDRPKVKLWVPKSMCELREDGLEQFLEMTEMDAVRLELI